MSAATELGKLGVRIFVISVGYQPGLGSCLTSISQVGTSVALPAGAQAIYAPSTAAAVTSNVSQVVLSIAKRFCTLQSACPPPAQASLEVSIGTTTIAKVAGSQSDGWYFADSTRAHITLSGSACDQYLKADPNSLFVSYMCSTCGGPTACYWYR